MPEILTESFCERCGTRYTFESATPRGPRLKGLKVMSRGLKNFVLSDDTSMDEAMAAARNETDREQTSQQLDAFHKTFNFCMSCRQYTCGNCWNEAEGRCLSCAPHLGHEVLPAPFSNLGAGGAVTLTDNEAIGLNDRNGHDEPAAATAPSEPMAWPEPEPMSWPTSDLMHEQELAAGPSSFQEAIDAVARLEAVSGPIEAAPADDVELPRAIEAAADVEEPLIPADTIEDELAAYDREQAAAAGAAMAAAAEAAAAQAEAEEAASARARAEEAAAAQARAQEAAEAAAAQARVEQIAAAAAAEARALEEAEVAAAQARAAEAAAAQARAEEEAAAQARAQQAAEAAAAQAKAEEAAAAAAAQARAQEAADAAAAEARAQQAAEAAAAQARAEEAAAAEARAREAAEAAAAQARADEEAAAAAAAAAAADEAGDDLVFQPTWQIVAPEPPTTDQLPAATPPATAPAAPPDTIAASAEPQWPAQPEWPRAPSADGLPFLGRPAAATGGIEALWAESAREVANVGPATSPKAMGGIQPCVSCGLSLSANARFCRRCGTRQG